MFKAGDKSIYMDIDKIEDTYEIYFYKSSELSNSREKFMDALKEMMPVRETMPDISLSRTGFIRFASWMLERIEDPNEICIECSEEDLMNIDDGECSIDEAILSTEEDIPEEKDPSEEAEAPAKAEETSEETDSPSEEVKEESEKEKKKGKKGSKTKK